MKLNQLTIKQASEMLQKKEITSVELTKACLARIKSVNKKLNALITVCDKEALAAAKIADERISKGEKGELLGIPYIAKDNLMTKGIKSTGGAKILENYIAPYDATVIKKLKEAGAVLLGKGNLDQFGLGGSGENSFFGPTSNPWDITRVPGGSSSGPAAAVASDMCIFAIGSDTGGSVRCPASFCGITGLKPTYGRNSRFGLMAMTSSTDTVGVLTKTTEDASLIMQTIAGNDKNDGTMPDVEVPDYAKYLNQNLKGLKFGLPEEYFGKGMQAGVREKIEEATRKLEELGAEVVSIKLPHTKYSVGVYYILMPSEVSSNLARLDGIRYGFSEEKAKNLLETYLQSRGQGFTPETKRRIMIGTYSLSAGYYDAYYLQAQKVRTKIKEELDQALEKVDAIITPTQPTTAFKLGEHSKDPIEMYLEDIFVASASLAGLPAISVPVGFSNNLPVGMQIIAKRFDEPMIFRVSDAYEKATDHHTKKAKL